MGWPREVAPRLARAHDQLVAERRWRQWYRLELLDEVLRNERLLVHRELQLIRAGNRRSQKYVNKRDAKLREARSRLAGARHALTMLEETPLDDLIGTA